jgi:mannose-6-phosphate isomerase-like protein (cupin superfamily)
MGHPHIIRVEDEGQLLALIIRAQFSEDGIHFFTPPDMSQQLGFMKHPEGKVIDPHGHAAVSREVTYTQEVLIIRKGRLRADFYTSEHLYVESYELAANDVLLLISGGHGFEVLEALEMLEVKQGPYLENQEKCHFKGVAARNVLMRRGG